MTLHHLIKEINQKDSCPYCSTSFSDMSWRSVFAGEKHYKGITCETCGKDIFIRVGFEGSGHDNWDGRWFMDTKGSSSKATLKTIDNKLEFKFNEDFFIKGVKK